MLTLDDDVDGGDAVMSTAATVVSELLDNAAADVDAVDDALDDAGVEGSFDCLAFCFDLRDCLRLSALASKTTDVEASVVASVAV